MSRRLVVEADGGSRGNPGPAAYGALVRDSATGKVLAEVGEAIGVATNNVAEYRGVIAGLRLAAEIDPAARLSVRLDSKLIVEQMSGRWKIKNADLKPLALEANRAFPPGQVSWEWVPREQNRHADRLVNQALDGDPVSYRASSSASAGASAGASASAGAGVVRTVDQPAPARREPMPEPTAVTTLVLVRHGQTPDTAARLFSGGGVPGAALDDVGRDQAARAADALASGRVDAVIASPTIRTRQTGEVIANRLGLEIDVDPEWRECEFGAWEGLPIDEVADRYPAEAAAWYSSTANPAPGGESLDAMAARVRSARDRVLAEHPGRTVVVVTHAMPIRVLVCEALGAPTSAIRRMRPAPASITELVWEPGRGVTLLSFGARL